MRFTCIIKKNNDLIFITDVFQCYCCDVRSITSDSSKPPETLSYLLASDIQCGKYNIRQINNDCICISTEGLTVYANHTTDHNTDHIPPSIQSGSCLFVDLF